MIKFKPCEKHKHMDLLRKQKSVKLGTGKEQTRQATITLPWEQFLQIPWSRTNKCLTFHYTKFLLAITPNSLKLSSDVQQKVKKANYPSCQHKGRWRTCGAAPTVGPSQRNYRTHPSLSLPSCQVLDTFLHHFLLTSVFCPELPKHGAKGKSLKYEPKLTCSSAELIFWSVLSMIF